MKIGLKIRSSIKAIQISISLMVIILSIFYFIYYILDYSTEKEVASIIKKQSGKTPVILYPESRFLKIIPALDFYNDRIFIVDENRISQLFPYFKSNKPILIQDKDSQKEFSSFLFDKKEISSTENFNIYKISAKKDIITKKTVGGKKGTPFFWLCPDSSYVSGIETYENKKDNVLKGVNVFCRSLKGDRKKVHSHFLGRKKRGKKGKLVCKNGFVKGIFAKSSKFVSNFGLICNNGADDKKIPESRKKSSHRTISCPKDHAIIGFHGGKGAVVDRIGPICMRVNPVK